MKAPQSFLAIVLLSGCTLITGGDRADESWSFEKGNAGAPPAGFEFAVGDWKVEADPTAPSESRVLTQLARNSSPTFNVVLATRTGYGDVDISVKMRSRAGEIDQGGGLIWRARDASNYYIARYNPLEDNLRVYKVVDGRRSRQLQNADIDRAPGWHTLRVTMKGDHIECYYDGEKHLDVEDSTFREPGKIGLWTKADAQTSFDDLSVSNLRP